MKFSIKNGIDIPLNGSPKLEIDNSKTAVRAALLGADYPGIKPRFFINEGDTVKLGEPLFSDKKCASLIFTSPASGRVLSINRGERRVFNSIVIEVDGEDEVTFTPFGMNEINTISSEQARERLLESGLWCSFRTRPFSRIPDPETLPEAIFVTAMDTNPLAPPPDIIISRKREEFVSGLKVLRALIRKSIYLCKKSGSDIPSAEGIEDVEFEGCHPAGLPGTHIHLLHKADIKTTLWHIGYQDIIAIGNLFLTGRIDPSRVISLAGPGVKNPRLLSCRLGVNIKELTDKELNDGEQRIISGSVLSGFTATGENSFLGRYHSQVSVIPEERDKAFLGWLMPGSRKHSIMRLFASSLSALPWFNFTTSSHGSLRSMVPIGAYEKVMPLDIKITLLLRSLLSKDMETAIKLGCLELDEEDLALCSYACPGKIDFGFHLREMLDMIEMEEK